MPKKTVELPGIGTVTLSKRKGTRSIRLTISPEGLVRVSLPTWVPYAAGITFAKQKSEWLKTHHKTPIILRTGMQIGKEHRLEFSVSPSGKLTIRVNPSVISVKLPPATSIRDPKAQEAAVKACIRALKQESEAVLPGRLRQLAHQHGFEFRSIEVKRLKSRWGSCNHRQEIVLNCFLMQLPWELIDYVLLHELVHTRIMAHGPKFWNELNAYIPDLAARRKDIRIHRPTVMETLSISSMS